MNSRSNFVYVLTTDNSFKEKFPELKYLENHNDIELVIGKEDTSVLLFSYPHIIPKRIYKNYKIVNIHNSLLPKYRGMHAFTWALINGETEVGYTAHLVDVGIDAGPILSQVSFKVEKEDDINSVFIKARRSCFNWLEHTIIPKLQTKNWQEDLVIQDHSQMTYFPKRNDEMSCIDWDKKGADIVNLIKAVAPPYTQGAYSFFKGKKIYFQKAIFLPEEHFTNTKVGGVLERQGEEILIKVKDGFLKVTCSLDFCDFISVGDSFERS